MKENLRIAWGLVAACSEAGCKVQVSRFVGSKTQGEFEVNFMHFIALHVMPNNHKERVSHDHDHELTWITLKVLAPGQGTIKIIHISDLRWLLQDDSCDLNDSFGRYMSIDMKLSMLKEWRKRKLVCQTNISQLILQFKMGLASHFSARNKLNLLQSNGQKGGSHGCRNASPRPAFRMDGESLKSP